MQKATLLQATQINIARFCVLTRLFYHEFLIFFVDVEGKSKGIETELVQLLAEYGEIPMTYAGGVGSFKDLDALRQYGKNYLDVTIGSALDLFGGPMNYEETVKFIAQQGEKWYNTDNIKK